MLYDRLDGQQATGAGGSPEFRGRRFLIKDFASTESSI